MNPAKIKKVLYREFTKSPAKTGFLLVMCPVALYFIFPFLLPGKADKAKAKPDNKPLVLQANLIPKAPKPNGVPLPTTTAPSWRDLVCWMEQDRLMRPSIWNNAWRDPFHVDRTSPLEDAQEEEQDAGPDPMLVQQGRATPEDLGLALTATVVSSNVRLATINGRTYRESDLIPLADELDTFDGVEATESTDGFILHRVDRRSVVLKRNGEQFLLAIPKARNRTGHTLISQMRND